MKKQNKIISIIDTLLVIANSTTIKTKNAINHIKMVNINTDHLVATNGKILFVVDNDNKKDTNILNEKVNIDINQKVSLTDEGYSLFNRGIYLYKSKNLNSKIEKKNIKSNILQVANKEYSYITANHLKKLGLHYVGYEKILVTPSGLLSYKTLFNYKDYNFKPLNSFLNSILENNIIVDDVTIKLIKKIEKLHLNITGIYYKKINKDIGVVVVIGEGFKLMIHTN